MGRSKKYDFEYHAQKKLYRKRIKGVNGKYTELTAKNPDVLAKKIEIFEARQNLSDLGKENIFVNDYIDQWFSVHRKSLKHNVQVSYESIIRKHIKPQFEGKRMLDIKQDDIKQAFLPLHDMSKSLYKNTFTILNMFFTAAVENKDIPSNPCEKEKIGGKAAKERVALTNEQCSILLDAVRGLKVYPFCMIALHAGLRREEILGLQWDCVFLEKNPRIAVKRALRFEHNRPVVTTELKTKAAKRTIPINPELVECLKDLRAQSTSEYVICNSAGDPLSQTQFKNLWDAVIRRSTKERVIKKHGNGQVKVYHVKPELGQKANHSKVVYSIDFEVTPHMLRHTYITNKLLEGVDVKTVQYLAGHEKSRITLDIYAHLTYNRPEDIIGKVRGAFGNIAKDEKEGPNGTTEEA